jgi:hypothetical protein
MGIKQEIEQRAKQLKNRLPIAEDNVQEKTNAELDLSEFRLNYYFLRFILSLISISLYLPTLIFFFGGNRGLSGYVLGWILVAVFLIIETALPFALYKYFKLKHSHNVKPLGRLKLLAFGLCFFSVAASSYCGIDAVDIFDNSQETIVKESSDQTNKDVGNYSNLIASNANIIKDNQSLIKDNISSIDEKKGISLTKSGKAQIKALNEHNKLIQAQNDTLIKANNLILAQMNDIRQNNEGFMFKRVSKANNKELIYMGIFFVIGLLAVLGLVYSYNFIGKYDRSLDEDSKNIKLLDDIWQKRDDEQHDEEVRKRLKAGERELQMIKIENALNLARTSAWSTNEDANIIDEKKNHRNYPQHQLIK